MAVSDVSAVFADPFPIGRDPFGSEAFPADDRFDTVPVTTTGRSSAPPAFVPPAAQQEFVDVASQVGGDGAQRFGNDSDPGAAALALARESDIAPAQQFPPPAEQFGAGGADGSIRSADTLTGAAAREIAQREFGAGSELIAADVARRVAQFDFDAQPPAPSPAPEAQAPADAGQQPQDILAADAARAAAADPGQSLTFGLDADARAAAAPATEPQVELVSALGEAGVPNAAAARPDLDVRLFELTPIIAMGLISLEGVEGGRFLTEPNAIEAASEVQTARAIGDGQRNPVAQTVGTADEFGNPALTTGPAQVSSNANSVTVFRQVTEFSPLAQRPNVNLQA
ncbi:MAG: hypothetical protein KY476_14960 [Planctomycetes bacterium]|nr:hypothetical protein [Planctomycetota bacterium]